MNIFELTYQTGEVAAATGVTNQDIQNWVKRELVHPEVDVEEKIPTEEIGGAGTRPVRTYTFRRR